MIGIYPKTFGSADISSTACAKKSWFFCVVVNLPVTVPLKWYTIVSVNTSNIAIPSRVTKFTPITGLLPGRSEYTTNAARGSSA